MSILGGLNANREDYATEFDPLTSLEAVFELDYQLFLFTGHDTKFSLALSIFPSLSQSGRVRTNLNSSLYSNLVGDLYWDLSIIASTDNQPPELSKGNDWSLISSLRFFF